MILTAYIDGLEATTLKTIERKEKGDVSDRLSCVLDGVDHISRFPLQAPRLSNECGHGRLHPSQGYAYSEMSSQPVLILNAASTITYP